MSELETYQQPPAVSLLPYVPPEREHTDGWIAVIEPVTQLAEAVAMTDFVPRGLQGNAPAVAAAILYGRELNMPPMQSLSQIHMIEGRPSVSAEQLRAMVLAVGHEIAYTELTGGSVTVQGRRKGSTLPPTVVTWTLAMAAAAELTGKKNWRRHPRQMLEARATAELCRLIFADVIHGVRVAEEVEDDTEGAGAAAEPGKAKVSRAKKGAESSPAAGVPAADAPPSSAAPAAPVATRTPRPPLPGVKAKAAPARETPGEGQSTSSTGAGAAHESRWPQPIPDPIKDRDAAERYAEQHMTAKEAAEYLRYWLTGPGAQPSEAPAEMLSEGDGSPDDLAATGVARCHVISMGVQCRYPDQHQGDHTFGGGLGDPVPLHHCDRAEGHAAHAYERDGKATACSGQQLETAEEIPAADVVEDRERHCPDWDNAHARHAWTDDEGAWGCPGTSAAAAGGPVEDKPEVLHPGQRRAIFAALKSLGVIDDGERHHTVSALLGRKVTTFTELTSDDGSRILGAVANVNTREDLEALIQEAAEKWGEGGA